MPLSLDDAGPEMQSMGAPAFFTWSVYDPANRVPLHATAIRVHGLLYLVDPIPLPEVQLEALLRDGPPAAILLTNANHARAAAEYRQRFAAPILAHAAARAELGIEVDEVYPSAGVLCRGAFDVIPLPGGPAGEVALYLPDDGGLMIVGDALIDLPPHGFAILPDKYAADPARLRRSVATLLRFPFARLAFAHGNPIHSSARERLAALLEGAE